jgi:hypothetical protein
MSKLFGWLPRARWKRWLILTAIAGFLLFMLVAGLVVTAVVLWRTPRIQEWVLVRVLRHNVRDPDRAPPQPSLSTAERELLSTNVSGLRSAANLFQSTNVWDLQLKFSSNQWVRLQPDIVPPVMHFMQPDGSVILRNPKASRNGLAGVFGLDFPWSQGDLIFGDTVFGHVGARFKGNGTFIDSQHSYKRPFKIALNKHTQGQELAGRVMLNLHNLTADASCLKDTLGYEFFRDAGVPASRTAFVRLRLTIDDRFKDRLLGLYVMVENPDAQWAEEQFNTQGIALFKPVTYELFKDLGDDWTAYEGIYDPKTKIEAKQSRRLIALAKLMTHANDTEFEAGVGDFIDVDEFCKYLACQVLLSNYDGPLSNGQNFLLYLDPRSDRFGFIPWDLDHSWGEFPFIASIEQREQASIWHPWVGQNRFLERILAVKAVRDRYRQELERLRDTLFLPERLNQKVDELEALVRPFITEESANHLARFERQLRDPRTDRTQGTNGMPSRRSGYNLRHFFSARAESVSQQLKGAQGVILTRQGKR